MGGNVGVAHITNSVPRGRVGGTVAAAGAAGGLVFGGEGVVEAGEDELGLRAFVADDLAAAAGGGWEEEDRDKDGWMDE